VSLLSPQFWVAQALGAIACSAIVVAFAPRLHQWLGVSHASRRYWIGAWLLAVVPTPLAGLLSGWASTSFATPLPVLTPIAELKRAVLLPVQGAVTADSMTWLAPLLAAIYLFGLGLYVLRGMVSHHALRRVLRNARPVSTGMLPGPATRAECARLHAAGIDMIVIDAPLSPFALRWPRRCIVLPRALLETLQDRALRLVLRHEAAHLAHRDPQCALLLRSVEILFWFNPLLRPLARRVRLAAELACDAEALAAERNMRRAYADAYLETLRMSMARALPCPAIAFSPQDPWSHRMRIAHIVHGDPRARKRPLLALALAALALGGGGALTAVQAANGSGVAASVAFVGPIIQGRISSPYGVVRSEISSLAHHGVDLTAARGTRIHAPAAGTVRVATERYAQGPHYGTVIVLAHGEGWQTVYAHLDRLDVAEGDHVAQGQLIGRVGSTGKATGPHVHVEVHRDGVRVDPATVIPALVAAR
jgi:murein DD-endopeptidase MepM/ murein hydrolase activator NlpD/Zn-dependent protease with chaperone function